MSYFIYSRKSEYPWDYREMVINDNGEAMLTARLFTREQVYQQSETERRYFVLERQNLVIFEKERRDERQT